MLRALAPTAMVLCAASSLADDRPRGMLTGGFTEPKTTVEAVAAIEAADARAAPVAFEAPSGSTSVYIRIAGGLVSAQHHGDFDPAAYPNVSVFTPPLGLLGPEYVQSDIGFAVGGAVGVRIPWSGDAGSTRLEAEYMFRTYTLDEVVYDEEFGLRPEADITGRVTSHAVMGNIIAEWQLNRSWRVGAGGGAGVLFSELKANGEQGDGAAFAAQALVTAQYRLTDNLWLTLGGRILGAAEVDYGTDVEDARTVSGDLTVGLSLEI